MRPGPASNAIAALVRGDLVTSRNGTLSTFNDQVLEQKKLIGLYFAARWCPSCRKFTPELVEYYNRVAAAHPEFEIIFVSGDRSGPAMETYMRDAQMPWPAVKYEKIAEKEALRKYAGEGIPCLVLVDATGKVISDSYAGKTYLGPVKVLADLDRIFGTPGA
ncbi:MAG: thioredoxin-like domain-containing protein, partial [Chthoniobacterales bacterium]